MYIEIEKKLNKRQDGHATRDSFQAKKIKKTRDSIDLPRQQFLDIIYLVKYLNKS